MLQKKVFSFVWHMQEYVEEHMIPLEFPRGYLSQATELSDEYMAKVVSLNGKFGWLGSNGRPDMAAGHSIIAGMFNFNEAQMFEIEDDRVREVPKVDFS